MAAMSRRYYEYTFFIVLNYFYAQVFAYISKSHNTIILLIFVYFHVSNNVLFLSSTTVLSLFYRHSLDAFYCN